MSKKQCGAKRQNKDELCKAPAMANGRCRIHGGESLAGIASPNFKTGKRSKYSALPDRLSEKVAEFINDPKLVELRENIAVLDARLTELYSMVGTGESSALWMGMQKSYDKYRDLESQGAAKILEAQSERFKFEGLLEDGLKDAVTWQEIVMLTEQRRKLVESESKRIKDSQAILTLEQFQTFVAFIVTVIKENVRDKQAVNAITAKLISARSESSD